MSRHIAVFISIVLSALVARAEMSKTSQLKNFSLHQCSADTAICFTASSPVGFVSLNQRLISAADASVEVQKRGAKHERYTCESFRYDMRENFLICDNRRLDNVNSFTIDSKFTISKVTR